MFGGQHRSDEAETARASWGDTSETRQPQRRDSRAMGKVCSWTEKIRIKSLETVGVVRDNAVTGHLLLTDSRACEVESTWSSNLPFGKLDTSCRYSASQ